LLTDNYLDNPKIKFINKKNFSLNFKKRILGKKSEYKNKTEKIIYDFFSYIEKEHPRNSCRELYNTLYNLQNSQEFSFYLCNKITSEKNFYKNIFKISLEKGGLAVLADSLLIDNSISKSHMKLFYGLGTILQLIDDLTDIKKDIKTNNYTIFTLDIIENSTLDESVQKTINYLFTLFDENIFEKENFYLKDIFIELSMLMIFEAVGKNKYYFSHNFLNQLENYFSFEYSYFKKISKNIQKELKYLIFS
ncbi:MAG: class 1 isoprenoid biosynthesis enzyme, partial [Clostridiales bacterium]